MQFSQLTVIIGLLTDVRDQLHTMKTEQRVQADRISVKLDEQNSRFLRLPRPRTPPPTHPLAPPPLKRANSLLPEEQVELSRGRYPGFPLMPSKSSMDLSRSPPYK